MPTAFDDLLVDAPNDQFGDLLVDEQPPAPVEEPVQSLAATAAYSFPKAFSNVATGTAGGIAKMADTGLEIVDKYTGIGKPEIFKTIGEVMDDASRNAAEMYPVDERNPLTATIAGGAAQGISLLAGGALGKAAGLGNAALTRVPLALGAAQGANQGIDTARELGVESPEARFALGALFGGTEVLTEKLGGIGNKAATEAIVSQFREPAEKMLKDAAKAVVSEGVEEIVAGSAQDWLARAFATEDPANPGFTKTGVPLPEVDPTTKEFLKKRGMEFIGGAAGGGVFAGAQVLANAGKPEAPPPSIETGESVVPESDEDALEELAGIANEAEDADASATADALRRATVDAVVEPDLGTAPAAEGDLLTDFNLVQTAAVAASAANADAPLTAQALVDATAVAAAVQPTIPTPDETSQEKGQGQEDLLAQPPSEPSPEALVPIYPDGMDDSREYIKKRIAEGLSREAAAAELASRRSEFEVSLEEQFVPGDKVQDESGDIWVKNKSGRWNSDGEATGVRNHAPRPITSLPGAKILTSRGKLQPPSEPSPKGDTAVVLPAAPTAAPAQVTPSPVAGAANIPEAQTRDYEPGSEDPKEIPPQTPEEQPSTEKRPGGKQPTELTVYHGTETSPGKGQKSGFYPGTYAASKPDQTSKYGKNQFSAKVDPSKIFQTDNLDKLKDDASAAGFGYHSGNGNAEVAYLKSLGYEGMNFGEGVVLFDNAQVEWTPTQPEPSKNVLTDASTPVTGGGMETTTTQRDATKPEQMTPDELAAFRKSESIRIAREALDRAKSGQEVPNVFVNGFKSKAAMVRARQSELDAAQSATVEPDVWQTVMDAASNKKPISAGLVESLSDKDTVFGVGPGGEPGGTTPSLRKQLIDNLASKGYQKQDELYIFQPETPPQAPQETTPQAAPETGVVAARSEEGAVKRLEGGERAVAKLPETFTPASIAGYERQVTARQNAQKRNTFQPDDTVIMRSPYTDEDMNVSYRGPMGDDKAVVWTGKSQMSVPMEWLRHPNAPAPKKSYTPERVGPSPESANERIPQGSVSEVAPPTTPAGTEKPMPSTKDGLIEEIIGKKPEHWESLARWKGRHKGYSKQTKAELISIVESMREQEKRNNTITDATNAVFPSIKSVAQDAGNRWRTALIQEAKNYGIPDWVTMTDNALGEEAARLARRIAEKQTANGTKQPAPAPSAPSRESEAGAVATSPPGASPPVVAASTKETQKPEKATTSVKQEEPSPDGEPAKPPDTRTIKQGDKVKFRQEGTLLIGTYQGVNADGTYSVLVKGEKVPRHVSARSLNENNGGAVVEGTRFSMPRESLTPEEETAAISVKLGDFLSEKTGTRSGQWDGVLTNAEQKKLFGFPLVGKSTVRINGENQTIKAKRKVGFGQDADIQSIEFNEIFNQSRRGRDIFGRPTKSVVPAKQSDENTRLDNQGVVRPQPTEGMLKEDSDRGASSGLGAPSSEGGSTQERLALPTGNRAMPLDKARAHVYNKLKASPRKVRVINEPSLKFRGRYDPDGTITLNSAYLGSVEELNDVLLNHESIHDAIETDAKVRQQADSLLDALTDDERADIEAEILDYKDGEFSAEQVQAERQVEAIRKLTANRPDLQSAWGRLVESVSLSFKKLLGVNVSRQQAELAAARIVARGLKRLRKGKTGGRTTGGGSLYGDAKSRNKTRQDYIEKTVLGKLEGLSLEVKRRKASEFATAYFNKFYNDSSLASLGVGRTSGLVGVRPGPAGEIRLGLDYSRSSHPALASGNAEAFKQWVADSVDKELIHTAELLGLRKRWEDSGKKVPFDQFANDEQKDLFADMMTSAQESETALNASLASYNLYTGGNKAQTLDQLMKGIAVQGFAGMQRFSHELVRQIVQINRTGGTTETGWIKFTEVARRWVDYWLNALKLAIPSIKSGAYGDLVRDHIAETEAVLTQMESGSSLYAAPPSDVTRFNPSDFFDDAFPDLGDRSDFNRTVFLPSDTKIPRASEISQQDVEALNSVWTSPEAKDWFTFGRTESREAGDIAYAFSTADSPITANERGNKVIFEAKNGGMITLNIDSSKRNAVLNILKNGPAAGQLYQAALTYLHNNNLEKNNLRLTERNAGIRLVSNMLSSALRHGTTKHLNGHGVSGIIWRKGDDAWNIAQLARHEQLYVFGNLQPGEIKTLLASAGLDGTGLAGADAPALEGAGTGTLAKVLARSARYGIGPKTVARAAVTASVLQGKNGAVRQAADRIAALKPLYAASPSDVTRFKQLTASIPPKPTAEQLETWKQEHPAEYKELEAMRERVLREMGYTVGPVSHRTKGDFTVFDLTKASKSSVWGPAIYATLGGSWNPAALEGSKVITGYVGGRVIDLSSPLSSDDASRLSETVGKEVKDSVPLITLERRFGSVAEGLKAAGYDAAIHSGPGATGKHIAVFSPSQIKSADPLATDDSGNLIPPDLWGNETSPDIRYGPDANIPGNNETGGRTNAGEPSRRSGGDSQGVSPQDNSERANAVREAAAEIDWENSTRDEKEEAVANFSRRTAELSYARNPLPDWDVLFTSDSSTRANAKFSGVSHRGVSIAFNTNPVAGMDLDGMDAEGSMAFAYDTVQEEMIHSLQYVVAYRQWVKAGRPGTYTGYVSRKAVAAVNDAVGRQRDAQRTGSTELAAKIKDALLASWNLYHGGNDAVFSVDELVLKLNSRSANTPQYFAELTRQMAQLTRQDFTTETGWLKFKNMVLGWFQDAIDSLKAALPLARGGQLGPIIRQEISELETLMKNFENGTVPKPLYSLVRDTLNQRQREPVTGRERLGQAFGQPEIAQIHQQQSTEVARQAAQAVFNSAETPVTPESRTTFLDLMRTLLDPRLGPSLAQDLIEAGNDMAPVALQDEMATFALRAAAEGDVSLLNMFLNNVNRMSTGTDSNVSKSARELAMRRWAEATQLLGGLDGISEERDKTAIKSGVKPAEMQALQDELDTAKVKIEELLKALESKKAKGSGKNGVEVVDAVGGKRKKPAKAKAKKDADESEKSLEEITAQSISDQIANRLADPEVSASFVNQKAKVINVVRELAKTYKGGSEEALLRERLAELPIPTDLQDELVKTLNANLEANKVIRSDAQPTQTAQAIVDAHVKRFMPSATAPQENRTKTRIEQALRMTAPTVTRQQVYDTLKQNLLNNRVAEPLADSVSKITADAWQIRRSAAIAEAVEKVSAKWLLQQVLKAPVEMQQSPNWRQDMMAQWLSLSGFTAREVELAVKVLDKPFGKALADVRIEAAERYAEQMRKVLGVSVNGRARLKKALVPAIERVQNALRTGSFEGVSDEMAKWQGWKPLSAAELKRLNELDAQIKSSPSRPYPGATPPHYVLKATHEMFDIFKQHVSGSTLENMAIAFHLNLLSGLPTAGVNIIGPPMKVITEAAIDIARAGVTLDIARFQSIANALKTAASTYFKEGRFTAKYDISDRYGVTEITTTREIANLNYQLDKWLSGLKQAVKDRSPTGILKGVFGISDIVRRFLTVADTAGTAAVNAYSLIMGAHQMAKDAGVSTKNIRSMFTEARLEGQRAYSDAVMAGYSPEDADTAAIDARRAAILGGVYDFVSPEKAFLLDRMAKQEGFLAIGRKPVADDLNTDFKGNEITDRLGENLEGGLISRHLFGVAGMNDVLEAISAFKYGGNTPKAKALRTVLGTLMYGLVHVPYRASRHFASYSPYGFIRYGVKKLRDHQGKENWFMQSMGTPEQEQTALWRAAAGAALMALIASLFRGSDEPEEKDKDYITVTGNGPPTDDPQVRDAWIKQGNQPYHMRGRLFGVPFNVNIGRGGEVGLFAALPFAVADDLAIRDKIRGYKSKEYKASDIVDAFSTYVAALSTKGGIGGLIDLSGKHTSTLASGKGIASAVSGYAANVIPLNRFIQTTENLFINPPDKSTVETTITANIPLARLGNFPALNRMGDPVGDANWLGKISYMGVPLPIDVEPTEQNKKVYEVIHSKMAAPGRMNRVDVEKKYGELSNRQWYDFVKASGGYLSKRITDSHDKLMKMSPGQVDDWMADVDKIARVRAANAGGLRVVKVSTVSR